jgi:N-acetylglucosaminyldiphosphoundecaprenol N-acetyl-beta-D-mannosaminyltransferase
MKKRVLFNSRISTGFYGEFIREIFQLVKYKVPSYVCFANVHMVVEAQKDPSFQRVLNGANIAAPDGKPVAIAMKFVNKRDQDRVCGMDMMPDLLREAEARGKSVYFYGDTEEVLSTIIAKASKEFPNLNIRGCYSPPFRELSAAESDEMIARIKAAAPDLVFVSLGCPKQEMWMAKYRDKLGACLLGVGQAFRVYAGVEKRLPVWMRNLCLEWLFRLCLEPSRLWKRYLVTNTYFLLLVLNFFVMKFQQELFAPFEKAKIPRRMLRESDE